MFARSHLQLPPVSFFCNLFLFLLIALNQRVSAMAAPSSPPVCPFVVSFV